MASACKLLNSGERRPAIDENLIPIGEPDSLMAELQVAFRTRLPFARSMETTLANSLDHLLGNPGSMVRPRIVLRMATAYGMEREAAVDLAIALEYFHTASLVFDDLPSMDNASMRRGVPCVHVVFGESAAMLAALALINRAYGLAWRAISTCGQIYQRPAQAYLEQHLGVHGLLNGQSLDLNYSRLPHTLDSTERVAVGKTVSLISLTLVLPAMAAGASPRERQLLERISRGWGLSYQVVDDLKDVLQTSGEIGKTAARDQQLDRPNLALTVGVTGAVSRLRRLLESGDRSLDALLQLRPSLAFLREFRGTLQGELIKVIECAGAIPIDRRR